MAGKLFYFTLGPVQGFVAQARRTRDFWAGSFLLSWLSGVAMAEIRRQGGEVTFPQPAAGYLEWIEGRGTGEPPRQGAIPNRFKAVAARVPQSFDGALLAQTVREAWCRLADHVWQSDQLAQFDLRGQTRQIWERQNQHFWEISWAVSDDDAATDLLDRRKNWRSHVLPAEPGVKCMMMDGWQELSGAERPGQSSRDGQASPLARFWRGLRESGATGMASDLREQEHLCALAYVKRRFARHFASLDVTLGSGLRIQGWPLEAGMPSVAYMAATHWLQTVVETLSPEELSDLYDLARSVSDSHGEWQSRIRCLVEAAEQQGPQVRRLLALDGNLFFEHVQSNPRAYGYDVAGMAVLRKRLVNLKQQYPALRAAPLSPYYAILLMDGDALGSQMSDPAKQLPISAALNAFTQAVPDLVYQHNGQLIYAGGDDVLAILPLEDALTCAAAVRALYEKCFSTHAPSVATSISAAVEYAHVKIPLSQVLADAHELLGSVAKDGSGRDAVAVRVWNTGGMALQWSQPWQIALMPDGELALNHLVADLRGLPEAEAIFTSKFLFKIRDLFTLLNPQEGHKAVVTQEQALDMLAVDFWHSADNRQWELSDAKNRIAPLLAQCRPVMRDVNQSSPAQWQRSEQLLADGALLVRFLATKGVE